MIDKKTLILAAAMVSMLGLADVGATGHGRAQHDGIANQHVQQQNHIVVEIDGKKFSQYDANNQTIMVDGHSHYLDESSRIVFSDGSSRVSLGCYLRMMRTMQSEKLGLFNDSIDQDLSKMDLRYRRIMLRNDRRKDMLGSPTLTWGGYLLSHDTETALRLGLYSQNQMDQRLPDRFTYGVYNGLTFREFFALNTASQTLSLENARQIYGEILNQNLSETAMRVTFPRANFLLRWSEYLCCWQPSVAKQLGLYTDELLNQEMPNAIAKMVRMPQGTTWRMYLYCEHVGVAKQLGLYTDELLGKAMPNAIVEIREMPHGVTLREYLCYKDEFFKPREFWLYTDELLDKTMPNAFVRRRTMPHGVTWREYIVWMRVSVAQQMGLYTDEFLKKIAPKELLEKEGLIAGLTWWEVMCDKHPEQMLDKLAGLRSKLEMAQFLQKVYMNSGKNWKNEIIPNSMGALNQLMQGQTWGQYLSAARFFERQKMYQAF